MGNRWDDYRYGEEAHARDLKIIWRCSGCGSEREDYPGFNEGGNCYCGGEWVESGESYGEVGS
jgi:hypothetical protein